MDRVVNNDFFFKFVFSYIICNKAAGSSPSRFLNLPVKLTDVLINRYGRIRIFEYPLTIEFETLPAELQLEFAELTSINRLKNRLKETRLYTFYAIFPEDSFPNLEKRAREMRFQYVALLSNQSAEPT